MPDDVKQMSDRELDEALAVALGFIIERDPHGDWLLHPNGGRNVAPDDWDYSTDGNAMLALIDALRERYIFIHTEAGEDSHLATAHFDYNGESEAVVSYRAAIGEHAASLPRATAEAAFLALSAEKEA